MQYMGPIIDSHLHVWDTRILEYPWLSEIAALNRPFLITDYREATADLDIEAMVFMQCEAVPSQALAEAEWVAKLARNEEPRIKTIIPWAPIERGEECASFLQVIQKIPQVKGVRRLIQSEADPEFCLQPEFIAGLRILSEYDLSFDICISHIQLANSIRMVQSCPEVQFVIDHIAKPDIKNGVRDPWRREIMELSHLDNVVCKVSGLVTEADVQRWTVGDLRPYIEHVIECFGGDRVMFGGDWPVCTLAASYKGWYEALAEILIDYSAEEQRKLFRDNAARVYRID